MRTAGRAGRAAGVLFMCLVLLFVGVSGAYFVYSSLDIKGAPNPAAPWSPDDEFSASDYLSFTTDGSFRILCISSLNLTVKEYCFGSAKNKLAALVEKTRPDLVLFAGNLTRDNLSALLIRSVGKTLGVPWAFTFGASDEIGPGDKSYVVRLAAKCGSVTAVGNSALGAGTNLILLKNSEGNISQSLFLFDNDAIKRPKQVEWYNWAIGNLNSGVRIPSILFLSETISEENATYQALNKQNLTHVFSGSGTEGGYIESSENVYLYSAMPFSSGATTIEISAERVTVDFFRFS